PGAWVDLELGPKVPSVSGGASGVRLGALAPAVYLGTQGQEEPLAIRSFNLNGDNLPDFIEHRLAADEDPEIYLGDEKPVGEVAVWVNTGAGLNYDYGLELSLSASEWAGAVVLDIDGDGRDDLIAKGRVYQGTDTGLVETDYEFPTMGLRDPRISRSDFCRFLRVS